jgi:hypothetical protein
MVSGRTVLLTGALALVAYHFRGSLGFEAEPESSNGFQTIVDRIKAKFSPSQLEEVDRQRTGMTVDLVPVQYDPSSSYAGHLAFDKTTTYVNDSPYGGGVSDVMISVENPYNYNLSAEDFTTFNAMAPGQELIPSPIAQLKPSIPTSKDDCCRPTQTYGLDLTQPFMTPAGDGSRIGLSSPNGKTYSGTLDPDANDSYTDSSKTLSLAQWRSEGMVDVVNDFTVRFRPYVGTEKMLRRV